MGEASHLPLTDGAGEERNDGHEVTGRRGLMGGDPYRLVARERVRGQKLFQLSGD
jgi:hypothetical protein